MSELQKALDFIEGLNSHWYTAPELSVEQRELLHKQISAGLDEVKRLEAEKEILVGCLNFLADNTAKQVKYTLGRLGK